MKKLLLIVWLAIGTASTIALVVMTLRPTGFWEDVKRDSERYRAEQRARYKEVPLDKPPVFASADEPRWTLKEAVAACHPGMKVVRVVSLKMDSQYSRPANGIFFYDGEAVMEDYEGKQAMTFVLAYKEGEELLTRYLMNSFERRDQLLVWGQKVD